MENKSLQEVQQELQETIKARKKEEECFSDVQSQLVALQKAAEASITRLHALKDQEASLQYKVLLLQKEAIKAALSVSGLKRVFSDQNPFVKKLKDKGKEIKEALDGTAFDKQWVDEQYEKYKESCIKKGDSIKSKEDFRNIITSLKEMKSEGNAQINAIAEKAGSELKRFGKLIQNSIKTQVSVEVQEDEVEKLDPPTTKPEGLDLWLKYSGATYNEEKLPELYQEYVSYLEKEFNSNLPADVIYSYQGGSFKKALKKALSQ